MPPPIHSVNNTGLLLFIFIYYPALVLSRGYLDVAREERDFIILIKSLPYALGKLIYVSAHDDRRGLALKGRERIAITHVGMYEMPSSGLGLGIRKGVPVIGLGISVVGF